MKIKSRKIMIITILFTISIIFIIILKIIITSKAEYISLSELTEDQIMKTKSDYTYGYQKDYTKNYFPYRLNNYDDLTYVNITYKNLMEEIKNFKFQTADNKSKCGILLDNQEYKLKNNIIIYNNEMFMEINDITSILEIEPQFRFYGKFTDESIDENINLDNEFILLSLFLKKYDKSTEILIRAVNKDFDISKYNLDYYFILKTLPGAIIEDSKFAEPIVLENGLIYISLYEILEFFRYSYEYNSQTDILNIQNNDNRENMTWQDIYINSINDFYNMTGYGKFSLLDVTNDGIPELFFISDELYNFETVDLEYSRKIPRGDGILYCFYYNDKNKTLDIIADSISREYIDDVNPILIRKIYNGVTPEFETCKWNEDTQDFEYQELQLSTNIMNKVSEFNLYDVNDPNINTIIDKSYDKS